MIRPLLKRNHLELVLRTGALRDLLSMLEAHTVDLVLSNMPVPQDVQMNLHSHLLSEQEVILVAHKKEKKFRFPDSLHCINMVLPSLESNIRVSFDLLMSQHGIRPHIVAEVADMAMLRLLAREMDAITLVPRVVVRDELENKTLIELHCVSQIRESFYAINPARYFPNALVKEIINPDSATNAANHSPFGLNKTDRQQ